MEVGDLANAIKKMLKDLELYESADTIDDEYWDLKNSENKVAHLIAKILSGKDE